MVRCVVSLIEAEGLLAADGDTSDPFCKLSIGEISFTSKVQKKTLCPKWEEEFEWKEGLSSPPSNLNVFCFDKDRFGKDALGHASVQLSNLRKNSEFHFQPLAHVYPSKIFRWTCGYHLPHQKA